MRRSSFRRAINCWLRSWNSRCWLRAHFAAKAYRYLKGRRSRFRCGAGRDFFFVHSDGAVYGCSVCGGEMGNLHSGDWNGIMRSEAADAVRQAARKCKRGCWMICTARSVYRVRRIRTALWIMWHKLLAHLWPVGRKK
jgi:radical SAM protein with 4Fe4S-binding SPASM domain